MSRPSSFNDTYQAKATEYVNECPNEIPSVAGLAVHLGVSRKTIYNWGDEFPEFLHTLELLGAKQEVTLLDKGLNGQFNATIAKLALHNHGHSDKSDNTLSGPDGEPIKTSQQIIFEPVSKN